MYDDEKEEVVNTPYQRKEAKEEVQYPQPKVEGLSAVRAAAVVNDAWDTMKVPPQSDERLRVVDGDFFVLTP